VAAQRWLGEATGSQATDTSYYTPRGCVCVCVCAHGHVYRLSGIAFFALMNRTFGTTQTRAHILHYVHPFPDIMWEREQDD
jgi:hypothetical protein